MGLAWAGVPALLGACAALALPNAGEKVTAQAAMLAVGALAILAGHTWGLLLALASHVPLLGRVWPVLVAGQAQTPGQDGALAAGAVAVVVVTALPVVALAAALFPRLMAMVVPEASPRTHALATLGFAVGLGASLVLPAVC